MGIIKSFWQAGYDHTLHICFMLVHKLHQIYSRQNQAHVNPLSAPGIENNQQEHMHAWISPQLLTWDDGDAVIEVVGLEESMNNHVRLGLGAVPNLHTAHQVEDSHDKSCRCCLRTHT